MADIQKKMAAALAAVTTYLQEEEAISAGGAATSTLPGESNRAQMNLWAQSGRQEMMNLRRLIQLRAFDRCR